MSFARLGKQQDSISSNESIPAFPAPPTMHTTNSMGEVSTPDNASQQKTVSITHAQKQALMDNLQLEITERARKLRAQYALQAQGLRSRLEMRVNRIPQNLRKRNMQELRDELTEKSKPAPPPPMPVKLAMTKDTSTVLPRGRQNLKRHSDQISDDGNKENDADVESQQDLDNPKKRAKTAATTANTKASRVASKAPNTAVLSPRSQNSRMQPPPKSPAKPAVTNEKSALPKSSSPVKSMARAAVKAIGRAGSRKKLPEPAEKGRTSGASDTSNGTTVVSRTTAKKPTAASKKAAAPKATAAATKKAAAVKKETAPVTRTAGGRTLRNRG